MTFQVSQTTNIQFLEHVVITTSLSVHGYLTGYESQDFYSELYELGSDEIDEIYPWMENAHPRRGDIRITLTSPQGTESVLLPYRNYDFVNEEGYDHWPFMSVHHWGENPVGQWTLTVNFRSRSGYVSMRNLSMMLYGTAVTPQAVQNIPTDCNALCVRGCSGPSSNHCDACRNFRVASTLACVNSCPKGTHEYHSYCLGEEPPTIASPQEFHLSNGHEPPTTASPQEFRLSNGHVATTATAGQSSHVAIIAGSAAGGGVLLLVSTVSIFGIILYLRSRNRTHRRSGFSFVPLDDPTKPTSI